MDVWTQEFVEKVSGECTLWYSSELHFNRILLYYLFDKKGHTVGTMKETVFDRVKELLEQRGVRFELI